MVSGGWGLGTWGYAAEQLIIQAQGSLAAAVVNDECRITKDERSSKDE
jgi:hypothetical protein